MTLLFFILSTVSGTGNTIGAPPIIDFACDVSSPEGDLGKLSGRIVGGDFVLDANCRPTTKETRRGRIAIQNQRWVEIGNNETAVKFKSSRGQVNRVVLGETEAELDGLELEFSHSTQGPGTIRIWQRADGFPVNLGIGFCKETTTPQDGATFDGTVTALDGTRGPGDIR